MSPLLVRRARAVAALGLLGLLAALIWLGAVEPVVSYVQTAATERGISLRALKRNRALLHQSEAIQAARVSVDESPRWRNFYDGPRADAATLQMEADLRAILKDTGNPTSMIAAPPVPQGSITRIAVRITLSMRMDQLAQMLDLIQKHDRQLRVESLIVQAPDFQGVQANPQLAIQAEITALMTDRGSDRT